MHRFIVVSAVVLIHHESRYVREGTLANEYDVIPEKSVEAFALGCGMMYFL
jgi:hypothetical protein